MKLDEHFIEFFQVSKSYGAANVIVKDFNLNIQRGEFICLIGHSGCGKSTVLSIAMGLQRASAGAFILAGKETDEPGPDRGVVFQSPALLPWMTARENVALAIRQRAGLGRDVQPERLAERYLESVGIGSIADQRPAELSAGARQRVGIARAFALDPKVLLLDEPFSLLDALTRMELQEELMRLWDQDRKTVIMVTHDVDEALFLADRIVMMTSGPGATIGEILTAPFPRPRSRQDVLNHPDYYALRDRIIAFLENQGERLPAEAELPPEAAPSPYREGQGMERVIMVPVLEI